MKMFEFLRSELEPKPGRFDYVLRITVLTVLVIIISEIFQIPEPAYSAYIVFFISKEDKGSTLFLAIVITLAITLSVFTALAIYTLSAGEPGLRLPLMAFIIFVGMFISRASPLGQVAFVIGFLVTISLTLIDIIPPVAPLPSAEILTQSVLWLWVVCMLPAGMVFLGNLFTGRDPMDLFNNGITERLELAGRLLSMQEENPIEQKKLTVYVRSSMDNFLNYLKMAGIFNKKLTGKIAANKALVAHTARLIILVNEWMKLHVDDPRLVSSASACGAMLLSLAPSLSAKTAPRSYQKLIMPYSKDDTVTETKAYLLLIKIIELVDAFPRLLAARTEEISPKRPKLKAEKPLRQLLAPDAFSNPDYVRYALKATLAIFIAYITYNMLNWPGIRTCMITCFFVSLGSVGETMYKMALRILGAVIGGGLGLATIIFIMPYLTTITGLCLIIAIASFFAGWVATSSERLSYAGLQIALAFFVTTLVGYGPTIDLTLARDRVIGILLGNLIVFLVFSRVWPESALTKARLFVSTALTKLSQMYSEVTTLSAEQPVQEDAIFLNLIDALSQARHLVSLDSFEPEHVRSRIISLDVSLIDAVQELSGPVLILRDGIFLSSLSYGYHEALSTWLSSMAISVIKYNPEIWSPPKANRLVLDLEYVSIELPIHILPLAYTNWYRTLDKRVQDLDLLINSSIVHERIVLNQEKREAM